jgi:CRP/FNR family transcriptional regulator, cyclic AMP receptor protein
VIGSTICAVASQAGPASKWSLLAPLPPEQQVEVLRLARRRRFKRGEIVFHEGDPGDTLHLVDKGHFSVRVTTPLGDVSTLRIHGPGGFFGELAVILPAARSATVVALTNGETLTVSAGAVAELRRTEQAITDVLLHGLVAEVRRLSGALVEALFVPVDRRVVRRLADLARTFGTAESTGTTIPLTQEELAELAGTTRPSVNRVLRSLEDDGIIEIARGRLEVRDHPGLLHRAR